MLNFLLRKSLRALAVLSGVLLITFVLMHAVPGNPWSNYTTTQRALFGLGTDAAAQEKLARHFGLDLPAWRQLTRYLFGDVDGQGRFFCGAICGNLGPSIQQSGRNVQSILFEPPETQTFWESRFGYSIRLMLLGSLMAIGAGVPLGVLSAARPTAPLSRAISVGLAVLISIPNFVLGLLMIIAFASELHLIKVLPDWDDLSSWVIVAVVLATMPMANIARVTHASLLNILNEDYIRTAHAKGLTSTRVLLVHGMRNALAPLLTFVGPALMEMFAGLFIVENLYAFPGLGREYWKAVLALDYPMILGLTIIYALGIVLINGLMELGCEMLDPRLRLGKAA